MSEGKVTKSNVYNAEVIATVAAADVTGNGNEAYLARPQNGIVFILDHTVDESTALDTLDVYIQTRIDVASVNWLDVGRFTRHLGNQGAERRIMKLVCGLAVPEFDNATALLATQVRHVFGDSWRVRYVITDNSGNAAFTFTVTALPM